MGDAADDAYEVAMCDFEERIFDNGWYYELIQGNDLTREEAMEKGIWITKTNHHIPLQSLDDSHLVNIINYCERHLQFIPEALCEERAKRKGLSDG